jgi:hypothetical protein
VANILYGRKFLSPGHLSKVTGKKLKCSKNDYVPALNSKISPSTSHSQLFELKFFLGVTHT